MSNPSNKENILLINRFPYWIYTDSKYPFSEVNLLILQSKDVEFDFPEGSFMSVKMCDLSSKAAVDVAVNDLYKEYKFTKVVNTTERYMNLAAEIRDKYSLKGMGIVEAAKFRDKIIMKNAVKEAGISVPAVEILTSKNTAHSFLNIYNKSIIKPIDGFGTKNTFVVESIEDLKKIKSIDIFNGSFEIEQFIEGDMYHCDSVIKDGVLVVCSVSKYLNSTLNFAKEGFLASAMIDDPSLQKRIEDFNLEVLEALEYRDGVTHLEVFLENNKLVFCEIAARPGGAGVIPSVKNIFGIDLAETLINIQLEKKINIPAKEKKYAGWLVIHKKEGTVKKISNESDFNFEWIVYKNINAKTGDTISSADSSVSSVADFTITGSSSLDLKEKIEKIRNIFDFNMI